MAQELKGGKARTAGEDGKYRGEQRIRKESAFELRTYVSEAFKYKARLFDAPVGKESLAAIVL
jgi:hypothetical protein